MNKNDSKILIAIIVVLVLLALYYYLSSQQNSNVLRENMEASKPSNLSKSAYGRFYPDTYNEQILDPDGLDYRDVNSKWIMGDRYSWAKKQDMQDMQYMQDNSQGINNADQRLNFDSLLDNGFADQDFSDKYNNYKLCDDENNENNDNDDRDFIHNKKAFTRRTADDIKDMFDVDKMLPQEDVEGWFDTVPLMDAKKVHGTQLIHPKFFMGVNTVSGSLRNASHDIRGDIVNPKISVSPFNNPTIEPDTNIRSLC